MSNDNKLVDSIKRFYDDVSDDLSFTCEIDNPRLSRTCRKLIDELHPDIISRCYGSAFVVPDKIHGCKILDMGCGAGCISYVLSKMVGENGRVVGIDISPNLIKEANKVLEYQLQKWGFSKSNVQFKVANVEVFDDVKELESTMDLVVSNGVICLCPNKKQVFTNIFKLLKDGGEFSLSDIYADRDRPIGAMQNQKLVSLGAACSMRWDDMIKMVTNLGFTKPYLLGAAPMEIHNKELLKTAGHAQFLRAEWRMFKLPKTAECPAAEVTYKGNIADCEDCYRWDINTTFKTGEPVIVDSDLATVLAFTRFKDNFTFKDITMMHTQIKNPFIYLEELKEEGHILKPAYSIK